MRIGMSLLLGGLKVVGGPLLLSLWHTISSACPEGYHPVQFGLAPLLALHSTQGPLNIFHAGSVDTQVWSLTSVEMSCQLLTNDLNQVSSVSLLMTSWMALADEGLF